MTLPASFRQYQQPTPRYRGILIGVEGAANTGKTEFCWSAPGPAIHIAMDRGHRSALENQSPPASRTLQDGESVLIRTVNVPLNMDTTQPQALAIWQTFVKEHYIWSLENRDARTVILDGDTDSWDLQFLAEFGRTNQIAQLNRAPLKAVKRALIARAYDSGKVFLSTSKLKQKWETVYDAKGDPVPDPQKVGQHQRAWDGESYERQGFNEYEYLYEIQLRTLYDPAEKRWGLRLLMVKANRDLEGMEMWGEECNLPVLLQTVYPHIDLAEWGY